MLANQIKETTRRVANRQIDNFTYQKQGNLHDYGIDAWTNGVLYAGMLQWTSTIDKPEVYRNWLMDIGNENGWLVPANFANHPKYSYYHADELCIGQFYLGMFDVYKRDEMKLSIQQRADWIMANPGDSSMIYRNKQTWSWCDALFMAPPVYAHLARITGNKDYLEHMHRDFLNTYTHLYDQENNLFFRDDSYFNKREENGEKIFWGRGNGWVLAGLARVMEQLQTDSQIKPFYEKLFVQLSKRLGELQGEDGFWHASLLDPQSYPSPETSATALICYGLAYGVNHKLLDKTTYLPIIWKAWNALTTAVDENGRLGWVQPIGADPKKVTREMTAVYGVGAFLMAGAEMLELLNNLK
jgi:Predicted unsaturated glucuronyl hydrolase involved in regulation of bacterial surface properties, and related proteins